MTAAQISNEHCDKKRRKIDKLIIIVSFYFIFLMSCLLCIYMTFLMRIIQIIILIPTSILLFPIFCENLIGTTNKKGHKYNTIKNIKQM